MSSAGRAVSTNGCVSKPKGRETGLQSCVRQIRSSSLTGSYVMETAEQQEPYESRGSRTVLGEPGGESPPGHSTRRAVPTTSPMCPEYSGKLSDCCNATVSGSGPIPVASTCSKIRALCGQLHMQKPWNEVQ